MKLTIAAITTFFLSLSLSATTIDSTNNDTDFSKITDIRPFTTDGCSFSPDGLPNKHSIKKILWSCCFLHDKDYWVGGTENDRLTADTNFRQCIADKGYPKVATIYYSAVRMMGSPKLRLPFRWGTGWPKGFGYRQLNKDQKEAVKNRWHEFQNDILGLPALNSEN